MRRLLSAMLSVFLLLPALPLPALGEDLASGPYTYELKDGNAIITDIDDGVGGALAIPEALDGHPVTAIDEMAAFNLDDVTSVAIPGSVTSIAANAFSSCDGLASLSIPEGVASIGAEAFSGCDSLRSVRLPASLTSIGPGAFSGCPALQAFDVAEGNPAFAAPDGVLYDRDMRRLVAYPCDRKGVSYKVPKGVKRIEEKAFAESANLKAVSLPEGLTDIGDQAFYDSGLLSVTFAPGLKAIGPDAFWGCEITSAKLPDGLERIGSGAFSTCYDLTSVAFGQGLEIIGPEAFEGCYALEAVALPDSVRSIGQSAFDGCDALTSVSIPAAVSEIGDCAFDCLLGRIDVDEANPCYASMDGVLFDKAKKRLIRCPQSMKAFYRVPDGVEALAGGSFADCEGLQALSIPASVTAIGEHAFAGNFAAEWFDVDADNPCYASADFALYDKAKKRLIRFPGSGRLDNYQIPAGVETIADGAFSYCTLGFSIEIPGSVKVIGDSAFEESRFESIALSEGTRFLGGYAFSGCRSLESVTLPASLNWIGDGAFARCPDSLIVHTLTGSYAHARIGELGFSVTADD